MPTLAANVRKAAAEATPEFDWLLGDRQHFTFKALSSLTGMSDSFLEKLWDDAQHELHISGHEYNAGNGERQSKRVSRAFAVRLLVKTARYSADEKLRAYLSCLQEFGAEDLLTIAQHCHRLIALRPAKKILPGASVVSPSRASGSR